MEKSDSRVPRTTPACHTPPARAQGMAATALEVELNIPGDTGLQ